MRMPDSRTAGAPMPIPKSGAGGGGDLSRNGRAGAAALSAEDNIIISGDNLLTGQSRTVSESDSFPESPYVNPFSPGVSNWGNMSIPKSYSLGVDNHGDWNIDTFNLGDERDLAHR